MTENIQEIMEEAPHGENHGRMNGNDLGDLPARAFRLAGGFTIVDAGGGKSGGGMISHVAKGNGAGPLEPGQYVDESLLQTMVERRLGHTYEELREIYTTRGRVTASMRQRRAATDARLLALSRAGGNMRQFSQIVGLSERTVERALARARMAE